jgi:heme/copper-type cytochrome/quinol oxidase subunit 1
MTITAPTSPAAEHAVFGGLAEPAGRSWITTTDHRRIGQLHLVFVLVAVLAVAALGFLVHGSLADVVNLDDAGRFSLQPLFAAHEGAVTGFVLLPLWMAVATMAVPGLIGARRLAFPRVQSLVLWTWVVAAATFVSAFLVEDGPVQFNPSLTQPLTASGSANRATELAIGSLILVAIAMTLGAANLIATVVTERTPGLRFGSLPPFAWGSFVGAVVTVLSAPVLVGGLFLVYLDQHFGGTLMNEAGALRPWAHTVWSWGRPDAFVLPIVAIAAFAQVVVSRTGRPLINPAAANGLLGAAGALAFTTWTGLDQKITALSAPATRWPTALVFVPLALVLLMALAGARGAKPHPSMLAIGAPAVMVAAPVLLAFAASLNGGVGSAGVLTFQMGVANALVVGAGLVALVALVAELLPTVNGRSLPAPAAGLALLLLIVGALAQAVGPAAASMVTDEDTVQNLHLLAGVGKIAIGLGALVALAALVPTLARPSTRAEEAH